MYSTAESPHSVEGDNFAIIFDGLDRLDDNLVSASHHYSSAPGCAGPYPGEIDCLGLEVQLCNQLGHSRPEESSEHYFACAAENEVGPGLLLMVERQGQDAAPLRRALEACDVPVDRLPVTVIESTLRGLPYGIAHESDR